MGRKDFDEGDLVWAKMKGFPSWPAKVSKPPDNRKTPKKDHHYVFFFGSQNYAWIPDDNIFPHGESMLKSTPKKMSASLKLAVDEIMDEGKKTGHKAKPAVTVPSNDQPPKQKKAKDKALPKILPRPGVSQVAQKKLQAAKKFTKPDPVDWISSSVPSVPSRKRTYASMRTTKVEGRRSHGKKTSTDNLAIVPPFVDEPSSSLVSSLEVRVKSFPPSSKRFGFLGLGAMGQRIVKNIINSGHHVTVWNRTKEKCEEFIEAGALKGQTVADVIRSCDITFSCVSGPDVSMVLVFGNNGVIDGLKDTTGKGYVEMTSIDVDTSLSIAEAVRQANGRYLEAPFRADRKSADSGGVVLLGCGDRSLFDDCQSIFHAIARHTYFTSPEIGTSSKLNMVMSMLSGTLHATMAENLMLAERLKVPMMEMLAILRHSDFFSGDLAEKGADILERNFAPRIPLKHMQREMDYAVTLSNEVHQTLHVSSAANEIFKHARMLGYGEHDACAVVQGVKY